MVVAVSYPGVYIDEFAPGAPIQGVSTNVAAFVGPASSGDIDLPTRITSWDQFRRVYGPRPVNGFYLWYAVRGFFRNGGNVCYVVRASNGKTASVDLKNQLGDKVATAYALLPGNPPDPISLTIKASTPLLPDGTKLYQPTVAYTKIKGSVVHVPFTQDPTTDARQFRVGDWVRLDGADVVAQAQRLRVLQVLPGSATQDGGLILDGRLTDTETPGNVFLSDLPQNANVLRLVFPDPTQPVSSNALAPGTTLNIGPPGTGDVQIVDAVQVEPISPTFKTYRVTLRDGLLNQISMAGPAAPVSAIFFDMEIRQGAGAPILYTNLASDPVHPRYYIDKINDAMNLIKLTIADVPPQGGAGAAIPDFAAFTLTGGQDESLSQGGLQGPISDADFIRAVDTLRKVSDVSLIAVPDGFQRQRPPLTTAIYDAVLGQCEQLGDRFAIFDPPPATEPFDTTKGQSIEIYRRGFDSSRGYGALYYPWLKTSPAGTGPMVLVPPSGHVCGLIARVDNTKGVFKAPANEILMDAQGVERPMSEIDHGILNMQNINVVRVFKEGGAPYVFGARTTSTDTNWQYVNIRRLFLYLEKSIQLGIRWAVFDPNNYQTWGKLRQTISAFLLSEWQAGGLFGATPKDAFYVRIDDTLNPESEKALGKLNIEIGVRPSYPAEFIIVRIGIWRGNTDVTEG